MIRYELVWVGPDGRTVPMTTDTDEEKIVALCEQMNTAASDGVEYKVLVEEITTRPLRAIIAPGGQQ